MKSHSYYQIRTFFHFSNKKKRIRAFGSQSSKSPFHLLFYVEVVPVNQIGQRKPPPASLIRTTQPVIKGAFVNTSKLTL